MNVSFVMNGIMTGWFVQFLWKCKEKGKNRVNQSHRELGAYW